MWWKPFFATTLLLAVSAEKLRRDHDTDRCTAIIVGAKAGTEGPMTTQTADCSDCDFRINKVPARDWPAGTMRPLYEYKGSYPGTITKHRGDTWHPRNLEGTPAQLKSWGVESKITGYIPEVAHTFALYEAGYGVINEHQVAMGESTCASRFWAAPTTAGGSAMVEVRELSHIALERATTAREAITIMGEIAEKYGFYSADWSGGDMSKGEGGEALTVIDPKEAWVFHITSDDTGKSAVWVAQRVPDNHVSVVANQFVIRHIDTDSDDFMYSKNIFDVAKRNKLWSEKDGKLDFLKTYSPMRSHPTYATRRVWRVFNLVAPNTVINPDTDGYGSDYPFSVAAEKPLTQRDLMNIQRDHYEGTQFDLTKGLAAGPYGDPNRFDMVARDNLTMMDMIQGGFERAISLFRTSYSIVCMARADLPNPVGALVWYTQHAPSSSSYTPLYVSANNPPSGYMKGSLFKYDNTVAFWNFVAVGNYAARFYEFAFQDVKQVQEDLETKLIAKSHAIETKAAEILSTRTNTTEALHMVNDLLDDFTSSAGDETVATWRDFLPQLITLYHDGYHAENLHGSAIRMKKLFYPKWWLDAVGYFNNKPQTGPDVIMFQPTPTSTSDSSIVSTVLATAIFTGIPCLFAGFVLARRMQGRRFEYQNIDL